MKHKELLDRIKKYAKLSDKDIVGLSISSLVYRDKSKHGKPTIIDYDDLYSNARDLIFALKELEKDGYIELIDTNNMGYFINVKN